MLVRGPVEPRRLFFGLARRVLHPVLSTRNGPPVRPGTRRAGGVLLANAEVPHLDAIEALYRTAFRQRPPAGLLGRLLRLFPQLCFVGLHEGTVVAFALCSVELRTYLPPRRRGSAFLATIAVRDDFRGRGIARALVETLIDIAANDLGLPELSLEVERDNEAAIALYDGLGFLRVDGVRGESPTSMFMARPLSRTARPSEVG